MRCLTGLLLALTGFAADFDLLIRDARVVDGTGNPWYRADVGIAQGRIAAIGRLEGKSAGKTVDARGRVLAPGFIDVHTHVEGGVDQNPRADNFLRDGVTAIVTGNCGGSNLDFTGWFAKLEAAGLGVNLASLVGHNSIRRQVMGAGKDPANPAQLQAMADLVDRAMRAGAVGFSTGLEYVPGMYVDAAEILALAKVAARHGGVYTSHMRDEGSKVLEAMEETIRVGREAGMRVQISHLKQDTKKSWGSAAAMLKLLEQARASGVDVAADQYPYTRAATSLSIRVPDWSQAGGRAALAERIQAPDTRAKIKAGMLEMLANRGFADYSHAMVASFPARKAWEGKTITEINRSLGRPAGADAEADTILDILKETDPGMVYHIMSDADVDAIMQWPFTAVASDGGVREFGVGNPHPRSYGTNARVLGHYVRERKLLTLEDAIRRMTSLPASRFGFTGRGQIQTGWAADLVLFDPGKVQDRSTFGQPHAYSEGFALVVVNGKVAVEDDRVTGERGGRALRHPQ